MTRVVLLGAGPSAALHARALRTCGLPCSVAGVFDDDREAAGELARQLDVPCFDELSGALESADAAICCGSVEHRARHASTAIARGLDVLVDTPIAANDQQAQLMVSAIVRAPRRPVAMVAHDELYRPAVGAIAELLSGHTIVAVEVETQDPRSAAALPADYDIVAEMMLGDIELIGALLQQPVVATQAAAARTRPSEPFDHARALLVLEDNTLVTLTASRSGAARVRRIRVTTNRARLTCDLDTGTVEATQTLSVDDAGHLGSVTHRVDVQNGDPLVAQARVFLTAIERRTNARLGFAAIITANEIAQAIRNRIALVDRRTPSRREGRIRAA